MLNWINQVIEERTGIPNCTFGELRKKIKNGERFRHLHVFSTRVGTNKEAFHFSSEDKRWDNLIIADAVRASMSLPAIYPPHTLHFKNPEDQTRYPVKEFGSFMDGGLSGDLINLPIDAFDKKRYMLPGCSELEGNLSMTNKRTLAFSLYTPGENLPTENNQVTCILPAYCEWSNSKQQADSIYKKTKLYDRLRTITISNTQVGTVLGFFETKEKLGELIQSGEAATNAFFQVQEERLERLKTFSNDPSQEIVFNIEKKIAFYLTFKNNVSNNVMVGMEIVGDNISFHTDYICSLSPFKNNFNHFSFTKLSAFDDRFSIFTHLRNARTEDTDTPEKIEEKKAFLEAAEALYERHESFYIKCFYWDIFRKLIIERNVPIYLQFFMKKGFSFANAKFCPVWHAYKHEAFKSFEVLLADPKLDLTFLEEETNKTLLYYFAKEGQLSLAKTFCSAFKARHPNQYLAFLGQEVRSSAGWEKTSFIISLEKKHFEVVKFLVEERRLLTNEEELCQTTNHYNVDTPEFKLEESKAEELKPRSVCAEMSLSEQKIFAPITKNSILVFPEPELCMSENEAEAILTFGPHALEHQSMMTAAQAIGGIFLTIITLPVLAIPAIFMINDTAKRFKTKKFELLALDDPRFQVFEHLAHRKLEEANADFLKNRKFFISFMKTCAFMREFILCLENCKNNVDYGKDALKCNSYIQFFIDRSVIPLEMGQYFLHYQAEEYWKEMAKPFSVNDSD